MFADGELMGVTLLLYFFLLLPWILQWNESVDYLDFGTEYPREKKQEEVNILERENVQQMVRKGLLYRKLRFYESDKKCMFDKHMLEYMCRKATQ